MAVKKQKTIKATALPVVDDLEILHPDRTIIIDGRNVEVREYRFAEGLRVRNSARDLLDDLHDTMTSGDLSVEKYLDIFASHAALVVHLISLATDLTVDEIERLSHAEGDYLMQTWWSVNSRFFTRAVIDRIARERITAQLQNPAGEMPTSSSSAAGIATATSRAIPSDR